MAESRHDELADALARLAGGEVAPSEHEPDAPPPPKAPPVPPVKSAGAPKPAVTPPRPAAARPSHTASPTSPIKSPVSARPAASPARPSAPMPAGAPVRQTAPPATPAAQGRPQRPMAPTVRHQTPAQSPDDQLPDDAGLSTGLVVPVESEIFDDEDAVIVPAPEPSAFVPKPKPTTTADFRARAAQKKRLEFKRTLIPVLLTTGVIMFVFASLKYCLGQDSPMTTLPVWVPVLLIVAGLMLLGFAVMNMLSVKAELDRAAAGATSK